MFKLQGWVQEGNTIVDTGGLGSSNVVQGSFPGATVSVYIHGSNPATLATIYSDDNPSPTPLANPFTANSDGTWGFYAASGRYDVVFSGGDLPSPFTIPDLTNGAGGGTGNVTGPGGAVDGDVASFDGTSGLIIKDSGRLAADLVDSPVAGIGGHLIVYDSSSGRRVRDAGTGITALVFGPNTVTDGNLAVFNGGSGKIIKDGGAPAGGGVLQASKIKLVSSDFTTGSASFVDITGATITITTGAHRCLITVMINVSNSTSNTIKIALLIDGTNQGGSSGNIIGAVSAGGAANFSFTFLTDVLTAGSHTFKLQALTGGGTFTAFANSTLPLIMSVIETSLAA